MTELKRVCVIEGDDASPEAVRPTIELLGSLGLPIEFCYPVIGEAAISQGDKALPATARKLIDSCDTTFFGSTNGASSAALFYLRWGKQTFANIRPCTWFEGARSALADPRDIDFLLVRENLEDLYVRAEGDLADLPEGQFVSATARRDLAGMEPGRYAMKVITEAGAERVIRFAFELALQREQRLTVTAKYNMLPHSDGLFVEVAQAVAQEYPEVTLETFIVDDFACRLITQPQHFDVVVMPNLYGDILSDAAAGLVGGLGMAASGCYGNDYAYFESAHGTAPDIAGQHIINPTANLLSAAMMLSYLEFFEASQALITAV
ncbi:MAG: isocitrate/isopropylmalate dehydrogenase family protein, partial [Pseudomonadales bacterium]|nr:isocitrate/isopropylmalate dehydrogenase family protein [Pseudomonadales bacterium]